MKKFFNKAFDKIVLEGLQMNHLNRMHACMIRNEVLKQNQH